MQIQDKSNSEVSNVQKSFEGFRKFNKNLIEHLKRHNVDITKTTTLSAPQSKRQKMAHYFSDEEKMSLETKESRFMFAYDQI